MVMDEPSSGVTYTIKEVIQRIDQTTHRIESKLEQKADKALVEALVVRMESIEAIQRERAHLVREFEDIKKTVETHETWKWRIIGAAGVIAILFSAAGTVLTLVL